ncbi:MAG TPA: class I SAM-dependent methyltransferase [Alphaproteobacteria bacterium]|nr:class I SAM-dependent methyltransferase [Alphaproteobacteria bacterium]
MANTALSIVTSSSLWTKIRAWWHGYDVDMSDEPQPRPTPKAAPQRHPSGVADWTPERIQAIQRIFGDGADGPRAFMRTSEMIKPLGMNESMSIIEVGAGIGVGLRVIAGQSGAWVDGVDNEPALIEEARRQVSRDGLQKKAIPVKAGLDHPGLQRHRRDVIISREALHRFPERTLILKQVRGLLKPTGQFLYTDYLLGPQADRAAIDAWCNLHPERPILVDAAQARKELTDLGFDVRVAKDETDGYCAAAMEAIQLFASSLKRDPVPHEIREWVMWEVEYWARTVSALESGGLRLYRFHAVAPIEDEDKGLG